MKNEALLRLMVEEPNKKPGYYAEKLGIKVTAVYDFRSNHKKEIEEAMQQGGGASMEAGRSEVEQLRENVVRLQNELNEACKREMSLKNDIKDVNDKYNAKSVLCEQYKAKLEAKCAQVADSRKGPELQAKYEDALKRISDYQDVIDRLTADNEKLRHTLDASKAEDSKFGDDYLELKRKADRYDALMNQFALAYMKEHFGIEVEA